jgi:spore germination protein Q
MNYYYPIPPYYPYGGFPQGYSGYPQYPTSGTGFSGLPNPPVDSDESSYIENILRLNLGKVVSIYMNFENSQWGSKIFKGKLEAAGKDHIIISDLQTQMRYLLLTIYLNYITFDEEINYYYPYQPQQPQNK